jgi:hypothetical protein
MNLNDNSIHGVNSAANQETESAPLNESASLNVDLAVILPLVPLPTNISELNPPSPIPLPEHQRLDIPDTPQTPIPQSSCRPRGSPIRAPIMQALNEIPSLEDKVSEKSSSNIRKDPPDTKNNTPRKQKKVKLTLENAKYQKNEKTRDTYYRTTSQRLRDELKILGIYSGCYAALYIHRYAFFYYSTYCVDMCVNQAIVKSLLSPLHMQFTIMKSLWRSRVRAWVAL